MRKPGLVCLSAALIFFVFGSVSAQTTEFTYQGSLKNGASPANGNYDFEFALFSALSGGAQVGATLTRSSVAVAGGSFAVKLDFGGQFPGANRFLEIHVRPSSGGAFTPLTPRQTVNSAPYSMKSLTSDNATNATQVGGLSASGFVQNTTVVQAGSNFNISGNGTAGGTLSGNAVNAATQYKIGGTRVLSTAGNGNTFVGFSTGIANTTGSTNTFVGTVSGSNNTSGYANSFFGAGAGTANTSGASNSFFGDSAGIANVTGIYDSFFGANAGLHTTGDHNAFFGARAGEANTTGQQNVFVGEEAGFSNMDVCCNVFVGESSGRANTTGGINTFIGKSSGIANTTGGANAFFGYTAGSQNTVGQNNVFLGSFAGTGNIMGSNNTIVGANATAFSGNLSFATAVGAGAVVSASNTIVLGRADGSDIVLVPGFLTIPNLAVAGSTAICRNSFNRIGTCSSSLRYKTNLAPYRNGLSLISQLKPITFDWKDGGMHDLGFGAEDVEKIDPLLVTYNADGQVEGVKYDRISAALVNAVKEQQAQIESLQLQVKEQRAELEAFKLLVCSQNPSADVCRPRN